MISPPPSDLTRGQGHHSQNCRRSERRASHHTFVVEEGDPEVFNGKETHTKSLGFANSGFFDLVQSRFLRTARPHAHLRPGPPHLPARVDARRSGPSPPRPLSPRPDASPKPAPSPRGKGRGVGAEETETTATPKEGGGRLGVAGGAGREAGKAGVDGRGRPGRESSQRAPTSSRRAPYRAAPAPPEPSLPRPSGPRDLTPPGPRPRPPTPPLRPLLLRSRPSPFTSPRVPCSTPRAALKEALKARPSEAPTGPRPPSASRCRGRLSPRGAQRAGPGRADLRLSRGLRTSDSVPEGAAASSELPVEKLGGVGELAARGSALVLLLDL